MQVVPALFTLYSTPCPAGYKLVSTEQQLGKQRLECECGVTDPLIITCGSDRDSVILEVYTLVMFFAD